MWFFKKPIDTSTELGQLVYDYGKEQWIHGFTTGCITGIIVSASICLIFRDR
jgi:hypothetical protein